MSFLASKTGNAMTSDTLNLTRISGVGAAHVALGVSFEPFVDRFVSKDASPSVRS